MREPESWDEIFAAAHAVRHPICAPFQEHLRQYECLSDALSDLPEECDALSAGEAREYFGVLESRNWIDRCVDLSRELWRRSPFSDPEVRAIAATLTRPEGRLLSACHPVLLRAPVPVGLRLRLRRLVRLGLIRPRLLSGYKITEKGLVVHYDLTHQP